MAGLAPVATRQRSNATTRSPPSFKRTARLWSSLKRASPCSTVMAGLLSRMPSYLAWRSSSTRACCWASSLLRSIAGTVAAMPLSNGLSRRKWAIWAARIMILDGTQPTLTQVPPMVPRSISVTFAPCSTAFSAAAIAAPPLPITATCSPSPSPPALSPPPSHPSALPSSLPRAEVDGASAGVAL
ncbi:hypothetical protein KLMIMMO101B1_29515 [Klebsiella michiganensis]